MTYTDNRVRWIDPDPIVEQIRKKTAFPSREPRAPRAALGLSPTPNPDGTCLL